jgi:outer membrane protein OmpA-like peptidoglycan-associated protein
MRRKNIGTCAVSLGVAAALSLGGCSGAKKGAAIGGVAGAATGAALGKGKGALIGGAVGAAAGAIIGDYMAKQKKELEKVPGADVQQVGDELVVTFNNPILFDTDSSMLKSDARSLLDHVASVLEQYPDTDVIVKGHTDNTGSETHNLQLSERRSAAVRNYLLTRGVSSERLRSMGFGESMPVAENTTESGRQQNRRVELQIAANQELRARAEDSSAQPH